MSYQVFYVERSDKVPSRQLLQERSASDNFSIEDKALSRARELLEDGDPYTVCVRRRSGDILSEVRLQLIVVSGGRTSDA